MADEVIAQDNTATALSTEVAVNQEIETNSTAAKPEDNGTSEAKDTAKDDKAKTEGAPETYEDFKIAEGLEVDSKAIEAFKDFAKSKNLTQAQAQELIDFQNKLELERVKQSQAMWQEITEGWKKDAREDKEIGGTDFDKNVAVARKVIAKVGTPELIDVLNSSGLGDNKEVIRAFVRIGKMMSEDQLLVGGNSTPKQRLEERLFPTMANQE